MRPGAKVIQCAINDRVIKVCADPVNSEFTRLSTLLGPGETAVIMLAKQLSCGVLIDEKLARNVAATLHLKIMGTVGILRLAKRKNFIVEILTIIDCLKKNALLFV